jgi:hypothetical protein
VVKRRFDDDDDEDDPLAMIRNMFGYCLDKPALVFSFGSVVVSNSRQPLYKLAYFTKMVFGAEQTKHGLIAVPVQRCCLQIFGF